MIKSGKVFTSPRLLALGFTVAILMGQQPAPVFRAGAKLVELTVTVLDKKGNAVAGLEPADFTILDEGKPRPVALFRFDGVPAAAPAATAPAPPLPPGVFSNRFERAGEETPRNITALVLDTLNTPPEQSTVARAQMFRYLRTLAPQTRVALFLMGTQLRILHDFTDDADALRAKLDKATLAMPLANVTNYSQSIVEAEAFVNMFAGDPAMQKAAEEMARTMLEVEGMANAQARRLRMERSLAAMEALGQHLAGIPGRKNLVWIGSGFSMLSITGAMGMGIHGSVDNFELKVRQASQRLAQQGIILYIVDSKGLDIPWDQTAAARTTLPPRGRGRFEPQMDSESASNDPRPAMGLMAAITGGRYLHNTNDLTAGFKQTATDMQGSYSLGFYMPGDPDNKWHKLKIQVKRPGVSVRHREGYLASLGPDQSPAWTTENWRAAFANPLASTVIPLAAKCERTPSGELALTVVTEVTAVQFRTEGENRIAELEVAIGDFAPDGSGHTSRNVFSASVPAAKWEDASKQGLTYSHTWKPAAEVTRLRVIVHDVRGGQYGTLDIPLGKLSQ
uniref:VWFA-related domain-containing protein n=1 Tax=Solibacter usitatus (strain Ellin6076) TaxID=234267 RepID=Q01ZD5_SOLUE